LLTDIVGSTGRASALGDARWEQPRAQLSYAPLAARPTPHDRLHQLARWDRREQLDAPAGRTS
jgi:hypothetical protein